MKRSGFKPRTSRLSRAPLTRGAAPTTVQKATDVGSTEKAEPAAPNQPQGLVPSRDASRRRRKPRKPRETERAHGSVARRQWMKRQPCVVCGRIPSDAAHLKSGGTGRKDDAERTVPMCSDAPGYIGHHAEYDGRKHAGGKQTFVAKYAIDLPALAADCDRRWRAYLNRDAA